MRKIIPKHSATVPNNGASGRHPLPARSRSTSLVAGGQAVCTAFGRWPPQTTGSPEAAYAPCFRKANLLGASASCRETRARGRPNLPRTSKHLTSAGNSDRGRRFCFAMPQRRWICAQPASSPREARKQRGSIPTGPRGCKDDAPMSSRRGAPASDARRRRTQCSRHTRSSSPTPAETSGGSWQEACGASAFFISLPCTTHHNARQGNRGARQRFQKCTTPPDGHGW